MSAGRWMDIARLRLRSLFGKAQVEAELDRELRFHLEEQTRENVARGMSPEEARAAARRAFGGTTQFQEECRDMRRTNRLESLWSDLRYAVRGLRRTPGFTAVMVMTLALSIGANSAIFSVVRGVLLRPLPYQRPERLMRIYFQSDAQPKFPLNPNDFRDFRARNTAFASMATMTRHDVQLTGAGEPTVLRAFAISSGYFRTLGLAPARGQEFSFDDERAERGTGVLLSDALWRSRFGADPGVLGRTIMLDGMPYTVAGVMPPGTRHPGNNYHALADGETVDVWLPFSFTQVGNDRGSHYMDTIARLKPGVSMEQAKVDLTAVLSEMKRIYPFEKIWRISLVPLYQETVGRAQRMLLVLLGAVGLLLLIACVNAANLLLARSSARVREIAVRSALGAARGRIVRQLMTESMVIALAGAALGTLIAFGGVRALVSCLPAAFPRASEIRLDGGVFAFTLVISVITGLLFGLVPALTASRTNLQQSLRETGRGQTGSGRQLRLRNLLVIGETGLACVLLIGAGLMLHSFVNLINADPGFRPQHVLSASVILPSMRYQQDAPRLQFVRQLIGGLSALPGAESAGAGSDLPWTGYDGNADGYTIEGRSPEYNSKTTGRYHVITPDYFRALGVPLLRGRFLDEHDDANGPKVILVNESMAKRYWPGEDAVGKRITFRNNPLEKDWIQIVGVVGDIKDTPENDSVRPGFYIPNAQQPLRSMWVVVRSIAEPAQLVNQVRMAVRQVDPDLAINEVRLMSQVTHEAVSSQRFALFLIGLFAALALVLATFGMYGVISYSVNQRMGEFGLRMALGAKPWNLTRMIVGQGLTLAVVGAGVGLLGAAGMTRLLGSLLYDVKGTDGVTFGAVALLALATAAVACYVPARRAMAADPMTALRAE
jgi:predicted permease